MREDAFTLLPLSFLVASEPPRVPHPALLTSQPVSFSGTRSLIP